MRHDTPRAIAGLALLCVLGWRPLSSQVPVPVAAILGEWHGTSICTKASWNAACNDEETVYVFAGTASRDSVLGRAYKRVADAYQSMGDLALAFDARTRSWFGDFTNSRVSIRVSYQVTDSSLTGRVVDLRTGQIIRQVAARRGSGARLPPD